MSKAKFDLHQEVTNQIIAAIEKGGTLPWVRPWASVGAPRSASTGRLYRGMNHLLLSIAGTAYSSNEWFTFNHARKVGGWIPDPKASTLVVYWNIVKKKGANGKEETFPILRYFRVYNRDQIEGLPAPTVKPVPEFNPIAEAEGFLSDVGADIAFGGDQAVYNFMTDQITLPVRESFTDPASFYATAFHEVVHWTGHQSRLDRLKGARFGSPEYAAEELVAELGAAFLCSEMGITGQTQHPEYIASWLTALKNDKKYIFKASSLATKAVGFLTGSAPEPATEE